MWNYSNFIANNRIQSLLFLKVKKIELYFQIYAAIVNTGLER